MKTILRAYAYFFKNYFPSPFSIAIALTLLVFFVALVLTKPSDISTLSYIPELGSFWYAKMFNKGLLAFTVNMMLILVLGHVMALSKPIQSLIKGILPYADNSAKAAFLVSFTTILVAYFNWGLGLIFGAILARNIALYASKKQYKLNYPLIGACGYVGLMVWHGGLSGSAPLTVAGNDHSLINQIGVISLKETLFSSMNLLVFTLLLICLPLAMYFVGAKSKGGVLNLKQSINDNSFKPQTFVERFEYSKMPGVLMGLFMLTFFLYDAFKNGWTVNFLNLNNTCLMLLGLALLLHGGFMAFIEAVNEAIKGASGILIQFPLYFGIMGIMEQSGLAFQLSNWFVNMSNATTLPIFTFISAGIVNVFIPSGGGQWQIQGPVIMQAAQQLGVTKGKIVMALAYGDQLTNMLQPFWALPLLGITGLKAKAILPYTLLLFLLGSIIFMLGLLAF